MRILVLLLITLLGCGACKEQHDHKGKTPLVEVDGNFLYKEDLMSVLPVGLSKDDSILFTEHYIRSWAEEILLYEKAANNIPDNVDVDKLVENYRKALISMHDQSFPVILHQLIYIHIIRDIIRCFFIQQNLLRPATNVMLGEKNTIIF